MLEEALHYIGQQAVVASKACNSNIEEMTDGRWLVTNDSRGEVRIVDVSPVEHGTVCSIEDLLKVADTYAGTIKGVYVSRSQAVLQLEDAKRPKSRYKLELRLNPLIEGLRNGCTGMDHRTCMRILRVNLASAIITPCDFKSVMSKLKFENTEENASSVKKGDESIGKSIRAKVTGEGDIPEEITVSFPIYPDVLPGCMAAVKCSVIIDSIENRINIIPIPGDIERSIIEAQSHVADNIRQGLGELDARATVPVICGTFCE